MATITFTPHDADSAAAMLASAADEQQRVVPIGHRTKLLPSPATDDAVPMATSLLTQGLEHYAGDLVATLPVGATLHDVNTVLAAEGQWLPIDPRHGDRATIGGIVATNDYGPRRHRYGAPRDLIIGIEVALTSGRVVRAGGRVVKNVAGYDLSRLFCGSHGSLGVITSATFKLAPLPQASRTVVARFPTPPHAARAALDLAASTLTPSAVELVAPEGSLLVRFESTPRAAERMADGATALLAPGARDVATLEGTQEADAWHQHGRVPDGAVIVSASVLPTQLAPLLETLAADAAESGRPWSAVARAALGIIEVHVPGDEDSQAATIVQVRRRVHERGGQARIVRASTNVLSAVHAWDPPDAAGRVAVAVKRQFDPAGILPWPWQEPSRA